MIHGDARVGIVSKFGLWPRFRPSLGVAEIVAASRVLSRGGVAAYEQAFASAAKQRAAIAFPYGRIALVAILKALDLPPGEVLIPANTCVVVAHAIVMSGHRPVCIDVRLEDSLMDLDQAAAAVTSNTRAVIPTSLYGHPVDLDHLERFQSRYPEIVTIQDACHSYFCTWRGRSVHIAGRAAFFAGNISKVLTSIFGGVVTTDDAELADRLRTLQREWLRPAPLFKTIRRGAYLLGASCAFHPLVYRVVRALGELKLLDRFERYYDPALIDMPSDWREQMTELEARVGAVQLRRYDQEIAQRRQAAAWWRRVVAEESSLQFPTVDEGCTYSHVVARARDRGAIIKQFRQRGVELGTINNYAIPDLPAYRGSGSCPHATELAREMVNFPPYAPWGGDASPASGFGLSVPGLLFPPSGR